MSDSLVTIPDVTHPDGKPVMRGDTIDLRHMTVEVTGWHEGSRAVGGPRRIYIECADVIDSHPMNVRPDTLGLIEA